MTHTSVVHLQVEFYFSDSNLPRDKFLREKIEEDPEVCKRAQSGWTIPRY